MKQFYSFYHQKHAVLFILQFYFSINKIQGFITRKILFFYYCILRLQSKVHQEVRHVLNESEIKKFNTPSAHFHLYYM